MNRWPKWIGLLVTLAAALIILIIGINLRARQRIIAPTSQEVVVATTPIDSPLPTPQPPEQPLAPDCELKVKPVPAAVKDSEPAN